VLSRLFGGRIDPQAIAPGPFAALPYSVAEFGRRVSVRVAYTPHPNYLTDVTLVHRAVRACEQLRKSRTPAIVLPWEGGHHRFAVTCVRLPANVAGTVPVWLRDFFFSGAGLPPGFAGGTHVYPLVLVDTGGPSGRFFEKPDRTATGRARQFVRAARQAGARPVRAALVQANEALFSPGSDDLPCLVVFSFDDRVKDEQLTAIAERVFDLKGTHPADPDLAQVAENITDERFYYYGRDRLPRKLTGGPEVFVADLMIHRPFLAGGHFGEHNRLLSCLAVPGERGALELTPPDGAG
jgi:hypothetical protein